MSGRIGILGYGDEEVLGMCVRGDARVGSGSVGVVLWALGNGLLMFWVSMGRRVGLGAWLRDSENGEVCWVIGYWDWGMENWLGHRILGLGNGGAHLLFEGIGVVGILKFGLGGQVVRLGSVMLFQEV